MDLNKMDISKIAGPIAEGIFSDKDIIEIEGESYKVKVFTKSGLKYVDVGEYRIVEQNPKKSSKWAQMARDGKQILWVFRGRSYYARVVDGQFTLLRKQ